MLRGYRRCVEGIFLKLTVEKGAFDRLWQIASDSGRLPVPSASMGREAVKLRLSALGYW